MYSHNTVQCLISPFQLAHYIYDVAVHSTTVVYELVTVYIRDNISYRVDCRG